VNLFMQKFMIAGIPRTSVVGVCQGTN